MGSLPVRDICELDEFVNRFRAVRDDATHIQLRNDLIEHLWQRHGKLYATND